MRPSAPSTPRSPLPAKPPSALVAMAAPPDAPDSALPPCTIRVSPRARQVRLVLRPGRGLEVVLPRDADPACLPNLLAAQRDWIARTAERMRSRGLDPAPVNPELPRRVELRAEGRVWTVHPVPARPGSAASPSSPYRVRVVENAGRLLLRGAASAGHDAAPDAKEGLTALRTWLWDRARTWLPARLTEISERIGISYASVRLAAQRTRWGSCSSRGRVSLNVTLLFLPPELVEQVLLHELCHIRHLDHSPSFWALVTALAPEAQTREAALRTADIYVPAWARP